MAVATFLVAATVHADEIDDFVFAQTAYANGEYEAAAQRLRALVSGATALQNPPLLAASRRYYAAALMFLHRREEAANQLEQLLRDNPDAQLDATYFAAETVQLFDQVRLRMGPELVRIREANRVARDTAQRRRDADRARMIDMLSRESVIVRTPRWPMFVPFGVGQFVNSDPGWGAFFMLGSILSGAATGTTYALGLTLFPRRCNSVGICENFPAALEPAYRALEAVNVTSLALLLATGVAGIVHANVSYRAERVEFRRRPAPQELLQRLNLTLLPWSLPQPGAPAPSWGLALGGRF